MESLLSASGHSDQEVTKEASVLPAVKRAAHAGKQQNSLHVKAWQDNERFSCQPEAYKAHGLKLQRFPPNSGDLNLIEAVWAWLRRDFAKHEQSDYLAGKEITIQKFKQRAAQILQSYGDKKPGQTHSRLEKLVRRMPKSLCKCKEHNYGRCDK